MNMTVEKVLQTIAGICSRRECCSRDILEKLEAWEIGNEERQKILGYLQQHKFVDDERFARVYAEDKFRFNGWGKQKITLMLRQKGIAPDVIARALENIGTKQYMDRCLELLRQKLQSLPVEDSYKTRVRLVRFAMGRGFDCDTVYRCLDALGEFRRDGDYD